MDSIHIYHTNDIHSHMQTWPQACSCLKEARRRYTQDSQSSYFQFDLGDAVDICYSFVEASQGRKMVEMMNDVQYDAATLGNNEGLNFNREDLTRLAEHANFDILISNLLDLESNSRPSWAVDMKRVTSQQGTRLGFFGLTFPYEESYRQLGWRVLDPMAVVERIVSEYRKEVDILVLLSHLGLPYDRKIAEEYQDIDLVLGAHTHHALLEGEEVGRTLLTGGGCYGRYLGHVELKVEDGEVCEKKARLIELEPEDDRLNGRCFHQRLLEEGDRQLDLKVVGYLDRDYPTSYDGDSDLSHLLHTIFQDRSGVEASILLAGLMLTDLKEGPVTAKDLHDCLPHSMRLVKITAKGRSLTRLLAYIESKRDEIRHAQLRGAGFRGERLGEVLYQGMAYQIEEEKAYWQGCPVEEDQDYVFVTVDFMVFSSFFPMIEQECEVELLFPDTLRQVVSDYLSNRT